MSTFKKICITNRHLVQGDFLSWLDAVLKKDPDLIILREKDLTEPEYTALASRILPACDAAGKLCILHSFTETAEKLAHPYIHLPLKDFLSLSARQKAFFRKIGVSVHAVSEAVLAEQNGASYVTASHIFPTDCKKDLAPRGLSFLKETAAAVRIPVYALGGICVDNIPACIEAGASGVCMMSAYAAIPF